MVATHVEAVSFLKQSEMRDQTSSSFSCKRIPVRYLLVILGHCGILLAYAMRANLSIGLVAMVNSSYVQERLVPQRRLDGECDINLQEILLQNQTKQKSMPMQKVIKYLKHLRNSNYPNFGLFRCFVK